MISRVDYSVNVNGASTKACLPFGPIIQPPDALMAATTGATFGAGILTESASYVFKATALQGIKNLFPKDVSAPSASLFGDAVILDSLSPSASISLSLCSTTPFMQPSVHRSAT
jgi:hypothetical protein